MTGLEGNKNKGINGPKIRQQANIRCSYDSYVVQDDGERVMGESVDGLEVVSESLLCSTGTYACRSPTPEESTVVAVAGIKLSATVQYALYRASG